MYCKVEGCDNPVENRDTGLCATHNREARKIAKPKKIYQIPKQSAKRKVLDAEYDRKRKAFLKKHQVCIVCKLPAADSIQHLKGRDGYADEWARENNIPLLLDERYWAPIHSFNLNPNYGVSCHSYVNDHPDWAIKNGYALERLTK